MKVRDQNDALCMFLNFSLLLYDTGLRVGVVLLTFIKLGAEDFFHPFGASTSIFNLKIVFPLIGIIHEYKNVLFTFFLWLPDGDTLQGNLFALVFAYLSIGDTLFIKCQNTGKPLLGTLSFL